MKKFALIAVAAFAIFAIPASGAKYAPTLALTPDTVQAGDYFDVSGCGYAPQYGNVIIGFTGGGWGSPLDANGCFTITHIPALSGDTLPAGEYPVTAYQQLHGSKWMKVAQATLIVTS